MPVWDWRAASLAPLCPAVKPGHLGRSAGLVDEDQGIGVEVKLTSEPSPPSRKHVRPLLLGCVRGFF